MSYPHHGQPFPHDPRWSAPVPYMTPLPYQQSAYRAHPPQHPHAVPFPAYGPRAPHYAPSYATPPRYPQARPDRGRDYLASLTTSVSNLDLQAGPSRPSTDKPLPRLPPPPLPDRPTSLPSYSSRIPPLPIPPAVPHCRPVQLYDPIVPGPSTPPRKSFTPSFHPAGSPSQVELLRPPELVRPYSDPQVPPVSGSGKGKGKAKAEVVDLTLDSDEEGAAVRSNARNRHRRAQSELPRTPASKLTTPIRATPSPTASNAIRCSGYTRAGQPCKRLVKSTAPYLRSGNGDGTKEERYCKDHAGMICQVGGFYWRGGDGRGNVWIDFKKFIPSSLSQQTQAVLRTTMESRLTDKDLPGFLYAYELRDLQTPTASFFKVGRTDNVPRRISEWSSQCQSHTPTLRDIFPRRSARTSPLNRVDQEAADLHRRQTGSYLPGAFHSGSNIDSSRPRVQAMKRWERLVHLELSDLSARDCQDEWTRVRSKCADCGTVHKEIFPVKRTTGGGDEYQIVVEVIGRWAAFVNLICPPA